MIRRFWLMVMLATSLAVRADEPAVYADVPAALKAARIALQKRDPATAANAVAAAAKLHPTPAQQLDLAMLRGELAEVRGELPAARAIYRDLLQDTTRERAARLRGGLALARSFVTSGEETAALAQYQALLAVPELSPDEQRQINLALAKAHGSFGSAALAGGEVTKARAEATTAMTLARSYGGADYPIGLLQAVLAHGRQQRLNDLVIFAGESLLAAPKLDPKSAAKVIPVLVEAQLATGQSQPAMAVLTAGVANPAYEAKPRLAWATVLATWNAATAQRAIDAAELTTLATKAAASPEERLAALAFAATCLNAGGAYPQCRQVLALADQLLVPPTPKTYRCRYTAQAPLGTAGWLLAGLAHEPQYREDRFEPYDQQEIARLITDTTTTRLAGVPEKLAPYLRNTAFSMVYDPAGWHIFVLAGEPEAERMVAEGSSAGSLELYFRPGAGATYAQWIIELPSGKCSSFDWNSPNPGFRPLAEQMVTSTFTRGSEFGTTIFIPWEALYDRLPGAGATWQFGLIRWTPGGGLTWGGQVHELSKFGTIEWVPPTAAEQATIKRTILRKAWGKFQATSRTLSQYWSDQEVGDPAFFAAALQPELARLTVLGEPMKNVAELTGEQVNTLYPQVVGAWMEFGYRAASLRQAYLLEKFTTNFGKAD